MEEDEELTKDDLAISLFDFLLAGTETSSTTMKWLVLFLSLHQEVQDRCRKEILRVIGANRCRLEDIPSLPYTQVTSSKTLSPDLSTELGHCVGGSQARRHLTPRPGSRYEDKAGGGGSHLSAAM